MDINTVAEILVTYHNGEQFLYKNKGLEKFRKEITRSPPLRTTIPVVTEDSSSDEESPSWIRENELIAPPPRNRVQTKRAATRFAGRTLREEAPLRESCADGMCPVPISVPPTESRRDLEPLARESRPAVEALSREGRGGNRAELLYGPDVEGRTNRGGYHQTNLNYTPSTSTLSPHDLAKQMIADAKRQGMNFS